VGPAQGRRRVAEVVQGVEEDDHVVGAGPIPAASATRNETLPGLPASMAFARAWATDGSCASNPVTMDAGHFRPISRSATPWPLPTSATRAPRSSRSTRPGTAGNQADSIWCRYAVRKYRSMPLNTHGC
jgi:hypothetical protein